MKCTKCDNCKKDTEAKEGKEPVDLDITLTFNEPDEIYNKRLKYIEEIFKDEEEPYDMDERRIISLEFCSTNCLKEYIEKNIKTDFFKDWKEYINNIKRKSE